MQLVTLAHVQFNRIGSASSFGVVQHKEVTRVEEVADESAPTLRELVISLAEELGDSRQKLQGLTQVDGWRMGAQPGAIVFNIHGPNVQYGEPYAVCYAHPALKIGARYFKLDEVKR